MGTTASTISLSEFANLPRDGMKHEIDAGQLLTLPPPKSIHTRIARLVAKELDRAIDATRFDVFAEAGYLLSASPLTVRQPDVSVLSKLRVETASADSYFEGLPELAVEVVSPKDAASDIQTKVHQYLEFGALQVLVLYPKTREVQVFGANLKALTLPCGGILEGCPVLPDVGIAVESLFAV
jgi:Uma2 family endonuclease